MFSFFKAIDHVSYSLLIYKDTPKYFYFKKLTSVLFYYLTILIFF